MALYESGQMYLETILVLTKKNPLVRSVDVGEYMGFSKPSVSRAMNILKKDGYITIDTDGGISLTEEGLRTAEMIYERHTVLENFLIRLGVDEQTAEEDACRMEHAISTTSLLAIKRFCENG